MLVLSNQILLRSPLLHQGICGFYENQNMEVLLQTMKAPHRGLVLLPFWPSGCESLNVDNL